MADRNERFSMPVPDDDGHFPFEVWKEGELHNGFPDFETAKAVCDRGNLQSGNFEVRHDQTIIYPIISENKL